MRKLTQAMLRRFGYQLVRNTRPPPSIGVDNNPDAYLPDSWRTQLTNDNPRLLELRRRYGEAKVPMASHAWWTPEYVAAAVDLAHFRGDNAFVWQKRHLREAIEHRYYLYARDVAERDALGLFSKLKEDGAFGCWVFRSRRFPALSRDLLDSVNELNFLERHAGLSRISDLKILDIGAGYGRLAHRCSEALPGLRTYFCTDAVPESTFLCERYLEFRGCQATARVVPLDELDILPKGGIQLAVNVHSFSEMSLQAIEGWLDRVRQLEIPRLFIVPNDPEAFLTMEADGTRRDFLPAIEQRGYRLRASEPAIADADVRELVGVQDHLFLFQRGLPA